MVDRLTGALLLLATVAGVAATAFIAGVVFLPADLPPPARAVVVAPADRGAPSLPPPAMPVATAVQPAAPTADGALPASPTVSPSGTATATSTPTPAAATPSPAPTRLLATPTLPATPSAVATSATASATAIPTATAPAAPTVAPTATRVSTPTATATPVRKAVMLVVTQSEILLKPNETAALGLSYTGEGTVRWRASVDVPWLKVAPDKGTLRNETDVLTISTNAKGLAKGQHVGKITFTAAGDEVTVTVRLTVP